MTVSYVFSIMGTQDTRMNDKTNQNVDKGEFFVYGSDFIILSGKEKRFILKTAKNLLKVQQENNMVLTKDHVRVFDT